ncbi:MAG: hypothetical protein HC830_12515 [Bacteroidetes bacterium]|nr:hypothetical protein [Bacteroidota bacterium]
MNRLRLYITIIFLFLGFFNSFGQQLILSQKFSFKFNHEPIESALDTISSVTGYSFSYNPSIISNAELVNTSFNQVTLLSILQDIFKGKELNFKEVCNYITITRKIKGDETPDIFFSLY